MGYIGEGLFGLMFVVCGIDDQCVCFLFGILVGMQFWCQGYLEFGVGLDFVNVCMCVEQDVDGVWCVYGQKVWMLFVYDFDWIFVFVCIDFVLMGNKGLLFLLMLFDQLGIEIWLIRQFNGGVEFNEVFFDGVWVDVCDLVGVVGDGWWIVMMLFGFECGMLMFGQQMQFVCEFEWVIDVVCELGVDCDFVLCQWIGCVWVGLCVMCYNVLWMLFGVDDVDGGLGVLLWCEVLIYKYFWLNWYCDFGQFVMDVFGLCVNVFDLVDDKFIYLQCVFLFFCVDMIYVGINEIQFNIMVECGFGMLREL